MFYWNIIIFIQAIDQSTWYSTFSNCQKTVDAWARTERLRRSFELKIGCFLYTSIETQFVFGQPDASRRVQERRRLSMNFSMMKVVTMITVPQNKAIIMWSLVLRPVISIFTTKYWYSRRGRSTLLTRFTKAWKVSKFSLRIVCLESLTFTFDFERPIHVLGMYFRRECRVGFSIRLACVNASPLHQQVDKHLKKLACFSRL